MKYKTLILTITLALAAAFGASAQQNADQAEIKARKAQRGVAQFGKDAPVVAAKGTWMFGGTLGYTNYNAKNYNLAIIDGINMENYNIMVKPTVMYMFANNFGVGLKGTYKRGMTDLAKAGTSFNDIDIKVEDFYSLNQSGGASVFLRAFLPLHSSRFAVIGDLHAGGQAGTSKLSKKKDENSTLGTYKKNWSVDLGVDFGMMAFFTKHFAMEAELGILGFGWNGSKGVNNQIYNESMNFAKAYYSVNFLSLSVGAYLYF